jgi:molybdenum cofactor synthesis domain-containing protein
MIKKIKVEDALGMVLAHDLTRITPGEFKGAAFKKGDVVKKENIPQLLKIGKQFLYVLELSDDELHEDDAAKRIAAAISQPGLDFSNPHEGKINIIATQAGLLKIDAGVLLQINMMDKIIVATLKNNFPCKKGEIIAATRIIPLTIETERIEYLEKLAAQHHPVLSVKPYRSLKVGAVVTGSEVFNGLVNDEFGPSIGKKLTDAGCRLVKKVIVPDDENRIAHAILELMGLGCDLIITTGGLSVDPDDVTRKGVLKAGANEIFYGSPVLPGAMLMISKIEDTDIVSLPACVFYYKKTVFDLIFPRVLAGEIITKEDIAAMGHGGLCMNCEVCHYPVCFFGR